MRKNNGWMIALFALVFIATPAIVGYFYLLKDWGHEYYLHGTSGPTFKEAKIVLSTGAIWGIAFGFLAYSLLLTATLVLTKLLSVEAITFNVPITFVFIVIFVTPDISLWARALIVIAIVLCAFPVNIMVNKLKEWQKRKMAK